MAHHDAPTDGPFPLPEFRRRLEDGRIDRNTVVRMPDGEEWMLLPSVLDSAPQSRALTARRDRLRRATAYRSVRWLVGIVAWLFYVPALNALFSERPLLGLLWGTVEARVDFAVRFGSGLLLGLVGLFVQFGGAMVVDLFDLLLGVAMFRRERTSDKKLQTRVNGDLDSRENRTATESPSERDQGDQAGS
jgi:hypothetical protein